MPSKLQNEPEKGTNAMKDRRKEMIRKMLMTPDLEKSREALAQDPENPELLYQLGMAVGVAQGAEASIDTFSRGLAFHPFNAPLHFGRGRKYIGLRKYWLAIADATLAIRLEPDIWTYWYYRAVPRNLAGDARGALEDFMQCYRMTPENEHYPLVDWMFLCCLDMGDMDRAAETLKLIDTSVELHHCMDYAYRRRIRLYKGEIKPEEMIDDEDILKNAYVAQPGRVQLEHETLTFGLFAYYTYIGDTQKANETLKTIASFKPSAAFGYLKGTDIARKRGLI